ncbi:putative elongation factor Ts [Babesia sp. Xinjiang]|uniref:putative elongation factor Ts n=1 Tax=Babesia sp. Xinjiang TaxID=462227 RepID=UPI000A242FB4|nr:putative elongation factor Ts [Babesia sp. Xinjiang]ORM40707.1 putative elongation factor Ts [Babesia sp. Xinjiang]
MDVSWVALRLWAYSLWLWSIANVYCYQYRSHWRTTSLPWPCATSKQPSANRDITHSHEKSRILAETSSDAAKESIEERKRKITFLRTSTGKGTQECYEALSKANGDVKVALDIIRQDMDDYMSTSSGGEKREVIDLLHGRVATVMSPKLAILLELRCETDFVARNNVFVSLTKVFANAAHEVLRREKDVNTAGTETTIGDEIMNMRCSRCSKTPKEAAAFAKMALNERFVLTRLGVIKAHNDEYLTSYLHGALSGDHPLNKVGSAAALLKFTLQQPNGLNANVDLPSAEEFQTNIDVKENITTEGTCCLNGSACIYSEDTFVEPAAVSETDQPLTRNIKDFVKHIAQHIVGARPVALTMQDYDQGKLSAAREEIEKEALASGKPKETIEKIVTGRLRKQFGEFVLMEQVSSHI